MVKERKGTKKRECNDHLLCENQQTKLEKEEEKFEDRQCFKLRYFIDPSYDKISKDLSKRKEKKLKRSKKKKDIKE
jgi:hypothetical protein